MEKIYSIKFSPKAKDDLEKIVEYISFSLEMPEIALKQRNRIIQKIKSLSTMPTSYRRFTTGRWKKINAYKMVVDYYVALYVVDEEKHVVMIHRIIYAKRNLDNL